MTSEPPPPVTARIDFASLDRGCLIVDARAGTASQPFTVETALPATLWASMAASTLSRWALDNRQVQLEFRGGRDGPQVRLTDGMRLVVLDLLVRRGQRCSTPPTALVPSID